MFAKVYKVSFIWLQKNSPYSSTALVSKLLIPGTFFAILSIMTSFKALAAFSLSCDL